MKMSGKKGIAIGAALLLAFVLWTVLVTAVDVQPAGEYEPQQNVGFATVNTQFHKLTGFSGTFYRLTEWLGAVPIAVCGCFGVFGLVQLVRRKSLAKVDRDILLLGGYYILVIAVYFLFEKLALNYRPVLTEGKAAPEASYPSTHTMLALCVMPTLIFQLRRRMKDTPVRKILIWTAALVTALLVIGRIAAGVHWLTDIIGSVIFSAGLYLLYRSAVTIGEK